MRILNQRAKKPVPLRKMPDRDDLFRGHPDVDELFQRTVEPDNAERPVSSSDQLDGRRHDAFEYDGKVELLNDGLVRAQQ